VQVDVIEDRATFERLQDNWNAVYDADPGAQLFLSWDWLSVWLQQLHGVWLILAAREEGSPDGPYCGFLPLRIETRIDESGVFVNELKMAGNHAADYTGLIALPGIEARVIAAFARFLKGMRWARLHFDNLRAPRSRRLVLLAHFPKARFVVTEVDRLDKTSGVDNNVCPYVDLPGGWDAYLQTLSANTRQKIRRVLRLADGGEAGLRVTLATRETIARDVDILLRFWAIKWRPRKGNAVDGLVKSNRTMLLRCFESGLLFLPLLWQGDRSVAALASLVDIRKRAFLFYMAGRDETFDGPPPGLILHGHSIRHAIANGFTRYDFLRGNERYKYSFGAQEARIACFAIATRDGHNLGNQIEPRTLPHVLQQVTGLHQAGKLNEAQSGYQQVLATAPRHPDALHRLGQLLETRGQHLDAVRIFRQLCRIKPDATKAWLCLAQACEAAGRYSEAVTAYRELVARAPHVPAFAGKLGEMLAKVVAARSGQAMVASSDPAMPTLVHAAGVATAINPPSGTTREQGVAAGN